MLQPENLLLAIAIVAAAYAWYRTGFRPPPVLRLPTRALRRAIIACGWILVIGIAVKSVGGLVGDGRVQIRQSGQRYAYRTREPMLFWGEIAGELVMVGGIGALLIVLGRKSAGIAPLNSRDDG
jgi:hypothetical protein